MRDAVNIDVLKTTLKREQNFYRNIRRGIYILIGISVLTFFLFESAPQQIVCLLFNISNGCNLEALRNFNNGIFSIALFFTIIRGCISYWSYAHMAEFVNQYAPHSVARITKWNALTRIWGYPFVISLTILELTSIRFITSTTFLSVMIYVCIVPPFILSIIVRFIIRMYWRSIRSAYQGGLAKVEDELRKRPNNIDLLTTKAGILMEQGQLPEAETLFRQLLEHKMQWGVLNVPLLLNNLGNCLLFQERYDEASEILESAIHTNPFFGYPYDSLADCYLEQNVYPKQALELTKLALGSTKSKMVDSQIIRQATAARAEAVLGNIPAAKLMLDSVERYMDKAQFAIPQMAETNRQIGYTYLALGDRDAARTYFLAATKLDPNGLYGKLAQQGLESIST
jgi:tetratricopeptide (TPR) repeat protein